MFLPTTCVACRRPGGVVCAECRTALSSAPDLGVPDGLEAFWALLAYEGAGRELVAAIKYHQRRSVVPPLARALVRLLPADEPVDLVTWVPTTGARRRARGYDQGRLLARGVAGPRRLPLRRLLIRRPGPAQTGRPARDRAGGPSLVARRVPPGAHVVVVDDVVTTGASMRAAARALRGAGARSVSGLALARTPLDTAPPAVASVSGGLTGAAGRLR